MTIFISIFSVVLCIFLSTVVQAADKTTLVGTSDELKPLTQQLRESEVGKWLSVWGDYGLTIGYNQTNERLSDYPGIDHSMTYDNRVRFGLRSKPVETLTLDISMEYGSNNTVSYRDMKQGYSATYLAAHAIYPDNYPIVPSSSSTATDYLELHRGYATLEVMDKRLKLAAGRRPLGDSLPLSVLQNKDQIDERGNPSLLETLHYDGFTLSYAPENLSFLGSHLRIGFGYGYDEGYTSNEDTNNAHLLALALMPVNNENAGIWFQWMRGFDMFGSPQMGGSTSSSTIDLFSAGGRGNVKLGPGDLHGFVDFGMSVMRTNSNVSFGATFSGFGLL
ncbi:MAG: DUF3373 family protein, partial [Deltaproteobacteria bacterium]|nr:DUF3373 family protein [Deltaproteobacteria bacterium]